MHQNRRQGLLCLWFSQVRPTRYLQDLALSRLSPTNFQFVNFQIGFTEYPFATPWQVPQQPHFILTGRLSPLLSEPIWRGPNMASTPSSYDVMQRNARSLISLIPSSSLFINFPPWRAIWSPVPLFMGIAHWNPVFMGKSDSEGDKREFCKYL